MAETTSRSYLRDNNGPRAVDSGAGRDRASGSNRRRRDGDDKSSYRPKRDSSHRSPKKDGSHRRMHSTTQTVESYSERPYFELDVIGQPQRGIVLGMSVETSILLSIRLPSADRSITAASVDTSRLFAVASLVADNRNGEPVPLEAGVLTGQKMFDSVHPIAAEYVERIANNEPCRLVLGYFTFPSMLIRQSGTYRIRTTLIKMSSSEEAGSSSILTVDSDAVKVDRCATATPRRHQRVHN